MRDCESCINSKFTGTEDNGCTCWDCEYISRKEAREAVKKIRNIITCKECKYYGYRETEGGGFPCCNNIYGAVMYREPDDFCSRAERKGE